MNSIEKTVKSIISKHNTTNPFDICEQNNIIIMYCDLPKTVKGMIFYIKNRAVIQINQDLDEYEQKVVCAHELGHYFLHGKINAIDLEQSSCYHMPRFEKEADLFCGYLLVNIKEVHEVICNNQITITDIASINKVPPEIVELIFAS